MADLIDICIYGSLVTAFLEYSHSFCTCFIILLVIVLSSPFYLFGLASGQVKRLNLYSRKCLTKTIKQRLKGKCTFFFEKSSTHCSSLFRAILPFDFTSLVY